MKMNLVTLQKYIETMRQRMGPVNKAKELKAVQQNINVFVCVCVSNPGAWEPWDF